MEKTLNIANLQKASETLGLSQSAIAESLGVTRAAVSKWFKGKSFPRPAELLKLGRLMELRSSDLVLRSAPRERPLVAFRKRATCKTTTAHLERAENMGRFLRPLVPYLGVDEFIGPRSLKNPSCDYKYLQDLAARLRRELDIPEKDPFEFTDLIGLFAEYQTIIVPTLWGTKSKHENALHLHLPESQTTWIYLNLDVEIHDFKFWMAHELGHVLTVDLLRDERVEEAEDFADAFAGALLFPEPLAERALSEYEKAADDAGRLEVLGDWAKKHTISPFSVYCEIRKFGETQGKDFTPLEGRVLHAHIAAFNRNFKTLSEALFDDIAPSADHFMRIAQENFGTEIYSALGRYVKAHDPGPSVIATILGVSPMDAKAYLEALAV
ncbi:MAG: ImmA/IrrE family metallo-endopeptidase [Verrucomicrobiae bacterium]|nr:ImmA/IrrE family metallo-endopeptidase [Verrucomicrobiae bacterium]MCB1088668.1 ImmA/IrrE family metallo-endopeptidase [Verrucomicrobiae bacterium]